MGQMMMTGVDGKGLCKKDLVRLCQGRHEEYGAIPKGLTVQK